MTDEYEGLLTCGSQLEKESVGEQPGINTLYTMIGEHFSGTSLHIEDNRFWSCNINLHGYKIWTCIDPESKDALESAIQTALANTSSGTRRRGRSRIRAACDQFVRHHSLVASPAWLRANGIPFKILCAGPGEAVITRPNQYHSVVNIGKAYSCAMNFVMPGQDPFPDDVQTCDKCGLHSIMQDIQARRPRPSSPRLHAQKRRKRRRMERDSGDADHQKLLAEAQEYAPNFVLPAIEIDAVSVYVVKLAAALLDPRTMTRLAEIVVAAFETPIQITQEGLGDHDLDGFIRRYEKDDVSVRRQQLMTLVRRRLRVEMARICSRSITGGRKALQPAFVEKLTQRFKCSYDSINSKRKEGQAVVRICRGHDGLLAWFVGNKDANFTSYSVLEDEDIRLLHTILEKNNVRYLCAVGSAVIDFVFQRPHTAFQLNGSEICLASSGETNIVEKVMESMLAASRSPNMQCKCDVSRIDDPLAALFQ
jgi:hypothetical protein